MEKVWKEDFFISSLEASKLVIWTSLLRAVLGTPTILCECEGTWLFQLCLHFQIYYQNDHDRGPMPCSDVSNWMI